MNNRTQLLTKATGIVEEAILHDRSRQYELAYKKYKDSLEYFLLVLKYEKDQHFKKTLSHRIDEYLTRTEKISEIINGDKACDNQPQAIGVETDDSSHLKSSIASTKVSDGTCHVKWDDVAGLDEVKDLLKEAVVLPIKFPSLFIGNRRPWSGILLYGPPGTGKSYLAKALASESGASFYSISSSDVVSKYQGESERLIKELFQTARQSKPSIIFIDEVDALTAARSEDDTESSRRIKTEFMVQMQGVGTSNDGVLVVGATNLPWALDSAIRRRFQKRIYVPLPDEFARKGMFRLHAGDFGKDIDFTVMARKTTGFSGSDISAIVQDALFAPIRVCQKANSFMEIDGKYMPIEHDYLNEGIPMTLDDLEADQLIVPKVSEQHFMDAVQKASKTVANNDLTKYREWTKEFGS